MTSDYLTFHKGQQKLQKGKKHDLPVAEVISETLAVFMQVKGKGVP